MVITKFAITDHIKSVAIDWEVQGGCGQFRGQLDIYYAGDEVYFPETHTFTKPYGSLDDVPPYLCGQELQRWYKLTYTDGAGNTDDVADYVSRYWTCPKNYVP